MCGFIKCNLAFDAVFRLEASSTLHGLPAYIGIRLISLGIMFICQSVGIITQKVIDFESYSYSYESLIMFQEMSAMGPRNK